MKRKTVLVFLSALLCVCLMVPMFALADFGEFSGDSDFGSSDWDTGSDWDSDWDDDWDDDNNTVFFSGGGSSSSGSRGGGGGLSTLFIAVIVVAIVLSILRKNKGSKQPLPAGAQRTSAQTLLPIEGYVSLDPAFDAAALQEKLSNLYVQMQNAWTAKDLSSVRPYFTDALFEQMNRQLTQMAQAGRTNYVERIAVLGVTLRGYQQRGGDDHIVAELRTRIVDYTLDDNTGNVLSGDRSKEKFMTYEWDICRSTGLTTVGQDAMTNISCPNCGAPLSINATAKCPYCDSVVTIEEHGWAISSIKGIAQQTA